MDLVFRFVLVTASLFGAVALWSRAAAIFTRLAVIP